jgi:hypothetical protein
MLHRSLSHEMMNYCQKEGGCLIRSFPRVGVFSKCMQYRCKSSKKSYSTYTSYSCHHFDSVQSAPAFLIRIYQIVSLFLCAPPLWVGPLSPCLNCSRVSGRRVKKKRKQSQVQRERTKEGEKPLFICSWRSRLKLKEEECCNHRQTLRTWEVLYCGYCTSHAR